MPPCFIRRREATRSSRIPGTGPAWRGGRNRNGYTARRAGGQGLIFERARQRKLARTFDRANLAALLRTPQFVTWQGERWLVHCEDFMTYVGEWQPGEFGRHAPDGGGRKLFMGMFEEKELGAMWDESTLPGATAPREWPFHVHVFRCRKCGVFRGHWDCD